MGCLNSSPGEFAEYKEMYKAIIPGIKNLVEKSLTRFIDEYTVSFIPISNQRQIDKMQNIS